MRLHRRALFARSLLLAAVAAALALFAAGEAAAQFKGRGGGFSPGNASFSTQRAVTPRAVIKPRLSNVPRTSKVSVSTKNPKITGKGRLPTSPPSTAGGDKTPTPGTSGATRPPRNPTGPVVGEKPPEPGAGGT